MTSMRPLFLVTKAILRKTWRILTFQNLLVTPKEEKNRLAICSCCPHIIRNESGIDQCGICYCVLSLKAKFVDERCPLPTPRW